MSQQQSGAANRGAHESPTLRDLSVRAMAGDHGSFEQIHRRVGAGLRRLLLRRSAGREDLVDELCQKTWTSVWKAFTEGKYDPERSAITTFVYAVGNNAWLTHLRSFARDQGYINGAPAMLGADHIDSSPHAAGGVSADDALMLAETIEHVRMILRDGGPGGMTEHERVVVRAIAAGESDRALARRLGLSSSTVNIRKHSGYAKIRDYLRARGLAADDWETDDEPIPARASKPGRASGSVRGGGSADGSGGGGAGLQGALLADHDGGLP
jgi:RNA polymerase sigma factor (sigma-70 family)